MSARSHPFGRGVAAGGALGALGVIVYFLLKNLGLGGHGSGRDEHEGGSLVVPPQIKDAQRLMFVMVHPTVDDASQTLGFRGGDAKIYTLEELLARVKAGGRSDVTLKTAGNVREGASAAARDQIRRSGIEIWMEGGARVSGNLRGQYGWGGT